jgi:hypothetical protein
MYWTSIAYICKTHCIKLTWNTFFLSYQNASNYMFNYGNRKTMRRESWGSIMTIVHDRKQTNKIRLANPPIHRRAPMTRNRILLNFHSLLPHFTHHIPDLRLPCRQHEPSTLAAVHGGGGARFVKTLGNREAAPLAVTQLAVAIRAP